MNHCRDKLNVDNVRELARFLQIVKTLLFHDLTNNFIGYLRNNARYTALEFPAEERVC